MECYKSSRKCLLPSKGRNSKKTAQRKHVAYYNGKKNTALSYALYK